MDYTTPTAGEYALGEARDLAKRLEIAEKRLDVLRAIIKGLCAPGALLGDAIGLEFERQWAEAVPPPPVHTRVDYAELAKLYPNLYHPTRGLGG